MSEKKSWLICDHAHRGEDYCLYDEWLADRQSRLRCIKHGTILNHAPSLVGLSRKQARAKLEEENDEKD